jgi:hypothetical protein
VANQGVHLWDRQTDEPSKWFDRLDRFRRLGPNRSLLALYNQERNEQGMPPSRNHPPVWNKYVEKWQWHARCAAWDDHERRERDRKEALEKDAEWEAERRRNRDARRKVSQALMVCLGKTLKVASVQDHVEPKELAELAKAAAVILKESRLEYGEVVETLDVTSKGEKIGNDLESFTLTMLPLMRQQMAAFEAEMMGNGETAGNQ